MARTTIPGDVPRYDENGRKSSRMVTFARAWFPNAHMHMFTDWEGADGVKVRLAYFKNGGLVSIQEVVVKSAPAYKPTSVVIPAGAEAVMITRESGTVDANEAPVGFRIDMWD